MTDHWTRLRDVLVEHLGVEPSAVTPQATLHEDLDADSLDVIELVMAMEEHFDVEISDDEVGALGGNPTVTALLALVERKAGDRDRG